MFNSFGFLATVFGRVGWSTAFFGSNLSGLGLKTNVYKRNGSVWIRLTSLNGSVWGIGFERRGNR